MIREFARRHMKIDDVRIDPEVALSVWKRGIRSPPRRIRVRMERSEEGYIVVTKYDARDDGVRDMQDDGRIDAGSPAGGDAPSAAGIAATAEPSGALEPSELADVNKLIAGDSDTGAAGASGDDAAAQKDAAAPAEPAGKAAQGGAGDMDAQGPDASVEGEQAAEPAAEDKPAENVTDKGQ